MSLGRLLLSVRDVLRTELELVDGECEVMPSAEPPPSCGQKFISVYGSNWGADGGDTFADLGIVERYDVVCAVTFRSAYVPFDRLGEGPYVNRLIGMEDYCRDIIKNVHLNTEINTKTDELINEDFGFNSPNPHKMVEYLRWSYCDANPRSVTGSWFGTEDSMASGLVMEVRFTQATRFSSFGDGNEGINFA